MNNPTSIQAIEHALELITSGRRIACCCAIAQACSPTENYLEQTKLALQLIDDFRTFVENKPELHLSIYEDGLDYWWHPKDKKSRIQALTSYISHLRSLP